MSPILKCEKLTKRFGDAVAINGLDLAVEPGRIVGLFGAEGSGKTTLLKLVAGLLTPDGGSVLIDGCAPGVESKRAAAYLPAAFGGEERAPVRDLIRYYRDFYADFDCDKALAALDGLGIAQKDKIADLSKGSLKKLRAALTVSRRAKLYLFDDPVGGVDTPTLSYILNAISGRPDGSAVVITARSPFDVERIIDDAAFISAGRITLFEDAEKLRADSGKSVNAVFTEGVKC